MMVISPRKAVVEMDAYVPPTSGREGKLRLDFNENTVGCSPRVIEELRMVTEESLSVYPEYGALRKKIADYVELSFDEVMATNATDEAIKIVMDTYLERGEEIIIPTPTFAMFRFYAQLAGASIKEVLYNEDLSFPTGDVLDAISPSSKIVVLVNPNNPTATSIADSDILSIVQKARENDCLVLIDEAYYQFYGKSSKNLIREYDNVIVIQTFSKAFGLAGIRLGYIMSNSEVVGNLLKAGSPYSVNQLAIVACLAALDDLSYVDMYVSEVLKARGYVESELRLLGIKTYPSNANFLIADFGDSCKAVFDGLRERDILVRDRSAYPRLAGCLRLGIGTIDQSRRLIDGIREILNSRVDGKRASSEKKVILFDMDGVLVDVSKSYREVIKQTAEFFTGASVKPSDIQLLKEQGGYNNDWDLTEALVLECGITVSKEDIISKFQELYLGVDGKNGLIDNETLLIDVSVLKTLRKKYTLGIVTGRPRKEAEYVINRFGLGEYFDVLVGMEDYTKGKPDPEGLDIAMERIGSTPSTALCYVGDSVDDMKAAVSAGVKGVGVIPPGVDGEELGPLLTKNGAAVIIESVNDVRKVIARSGGGSNE